MTGKSWPYFKDAEFRFYIFTILVIGTVIGVLIWLQTPESVTGAVRLSFFQVVSILTTTGYTTVDYEQWSLLVQFILFALMFYGGCGGSTGGSIKCVRILLLLKQAYKEVYQLIHPRAISAIKLGKKTVPSNVMESVLAFFLLYVGIFLAATALMSFLGLDFQSALSSVAACIGNVGPGLGVVGPAETYHSIVPAGKWVLIGCMLLGRLEIFTLLVLFLPEFWKK